MSWSGFKKNVGRATTQVMMKTGHVEKTSDREYEVEERRFRTLESASLRLQKEAKGYLDSLRAMTASQMRIAETIDAFYGDSGAHDGVSRSYKQAVTDLDAETIKALDGPYRCVPRDLCKHAWQDGGTINEDAIAEIEWQINAGRVQTQAAQQHAPYRQFDELMDYVYRTTVLEPINRFCAYFPDINECIKKRNHKMLDYDALRSKVRKLTEKPDKDASKLPRTEKELEMVSVNTVLCESRSMSAIPDLPNRPSIERRRQFQRSHTYTPTASAIDDAVLDDFDMPSPPKVLHKVNRRATDKLPPMEPLLEGHVLQSISFSNADAHWQDHFRSLAATPSSFVSSRKAITPSPDRDLDLTLSPSRHPSLLSRSSTLNSLSSNKSGTLAHRLSDSTSASASSVRSPSHSVLHMGRRAATTSPSFDSRALDEIMRPVKENFVRTQADKFIQAKAAYDQLNDQLTSELPQLIDLRVPYLDPSFEALVKIQLRFCAEAYSRMAQVQQYLDASTRDSYASGELDARVEDVLGQIRELSIAGTV